MKKYFRYLIVALYIPAFLLIFSQQTLAQKCYIIADRLKEYLGISSGFDTRLRVERKTTNYNIEAEEFKKIIAGTFHEDLGESFTLRDRPSSEERVLVTSTNYPFDRKVQSKMSSRIRIREYGERPIGSNERFISSSGENGTVSLEIKAKTEYPGVVVKPILKVRKSDLPVIFTNGKTLREKEGNILEDLKADNPGEEDLAIEVMNIVGQFHDKSESLGKPLTADNVEYQRQGYVLVVKNIGTGETHKVQMTFDIAVQMRGNVDPKLSPWDISAQAPTHRYPSGEKAVTVIEMKSDLEIDKLYLDDPDYVKRNIPTYWSVRKKYEEMQENPAEGFIADSGKGAQLLDFWVD